MRMAAGNFSRRWGTIKGLKKMDLFFVFFGYFYRYHIYTPQKTKKQQLVNKVNNMSTSRHRAKPAENRLDDIIGASIYYFWIIGAEDPSNFWARGKVTKEKVGEKGYYFVKFQKRKGRPATLLIPLSNPKLYSLWYRDDSLDGVPVVQNTSSNVRTWVQCSRQCCSNWVKLPTGLHRYCKSFCCGHAGLWEKVQTPCMDPPPLPPPAPPPSASVSSRKRPASVLSRYEILRLENVQRNREFLISLGLDLPKSNKSVTPSKRRKKRSSSSSSSSSLSSEGPTPPARKSNRPRKERIFFHNETELIKQRRFEAVTNAVANSEAAYHEINVYGPDSDAKVEKDDPLVLQWEVPPGDVSLELLQGGYIVLIRQYSTLEDVYWLKRSLTDEEATNQSVLLDFPNFIGAGKGFLLEIGCERTKSVGRSEIFQLVDPVGHKCYNDSDASVWCICGVTRYKLGKKYTGEWLQCSVCHAWQHKNCYLKRETQHPSFKCRWCRKDENIAAQMSVAKTNRLALLVTGEQNILLRGLGSSCSLPN